MRLMVTVYPLLVSIRDSRIAGVITSVSGMTGISPFELAKHAAVPIAVSCFPVLARPFVFLFPGITPQKGNKKASALK